MASVDDISLVRMKLGDSLKIGLDRDTGDGTVKVFVLTHKNIQDYIVTVGGVEKTETIDYIASVADGSIKFNTAPSNAAEIVVEYKYAAFTDDEISTLIDTYGSVNSAVIEAIKVLMADAARRFDYTQGDTDMKPSQVFTHLKDLLSIYQKSLPPQFVNLTSKHYESETRNTVDLSRADLGVDDE